MLKNDMNNTTLLMIRTPYDGHMDTLYDRNRIVILQVETHVDEMENMNAPDSNYINLCEKTYSRAINNIFYDSRNKLIHIDDKQYRFKGGISEI